jgi:zinc protease
MKEFLTGLSVLLICFVAMGSVSFSGSIFPYKYTKETLDNGLTIYMIPMESPGVIAYYSVVRTGSRDEVEPGKTGFAHFFEHMMFHGTVKYPAAARESIMTSMGANPNAFTSDDITAYHGVYAKEDLEKVIDLESDRFQNLHYELQDFQTEAGAVYGEYRKNVTSPFAILSEKMQDLAYDVHTYKHTTMGFEADIKAMPEAFDYSKSFFNRFYRPENVVLVIVGDIDPPATLELLKKYYSGWQKGYKPSDVPKEPPHTKERTAEVSFPGKTLPILDITYQGDALDATNIDFAAAMLLSDLAFGETSDLYKKLYLQEQKVESINADVPVNRDAPLFEIYAMVKKAEDVNYVRDEIYRTLEESKTKPVDATKLENLKKRNKYGFLMGLDTPERVAGGLARFIAITGGIEVIDQLYTTMDKVTPADIMHAAQKYYVPEHRSVIVLKGAQQ